MSLYKLQMTLQFKHLPGKHNQKLHNPRKGGTIAIPRNEATIARIKASQAAYYDADVLKAATDNLRTLVANRPICVNLPADVIPLIIETGIKNQHETDTSNGTLTPRYRREAEQRAFGSQLQQPADFPVYGYVDTDPKLLESQAYNYGDAKVYLKDDIKARTTIAMNDSLALFANGMMTGTPVLNPGSEGLGAAVMLLKQLPTTEPYSQYDVEFVEAQIHGGIKPYDIAKIQLPRPVRGDMAAELEHSILVDKIEQAGIAWSY